MDEPPPSSSCPPKVLLIYIIKFGFYVHKLVRIEILILVCIIGEYGKLRGIFGQPPEESTKKFTWRICPKTFREIFDATCSDLSRRSESDHSFIKDCIQNYSALLR